MEMSHLDRIEELQSLYDKKISIENSQYLKLEQNLIELKQKHGEKIKELEANNRKNYN